MIHAIETVETKANQFSGLGDEIQVKECLQVIARKEFAEHTPYCEKP
jgi:hypothetical protein